MFTGRVEELDTLHSFMSSETQVLCLYGRAGMGKTSLIKEFLKSQEGCYFCAYPTTGKRELALAQRSICRGQEVASLGDVLANVEDGAKAILAQGGTYCFCIDNYGAFAKADASFAKALHGYVRTYWKDGRIKLLLCEDSYLNAIKLMTSTGAIWQDFDPVLLELKEMNFYEAQRFFADALPEEKVLYYGITGGIPAYLHSVRATVEETLETLYFGDGTRAGAGMPEQSIAGELREMSYYNCLLETLASGKNRVNAISAEVEKPKDVVVPYLTTLIHIGVVKKENPITEKNNRKKTRYSIVNTSDIFWYRFIAPRINDYYEGRMMETWEKEISPNMGKFLQQVFIEMCKDYLLQCSASGELPFHIDEIGKWWENDDENNTTEGFDVVALGELHEVSSMLFARCFYKERPIEMADLKELIDLTRHLKHEENVYYVIFSKSGFHRNAQTAASAIKNIILITLDEVCSWKRTK